MYIDSLTITAIAVFVVALAAFIRFCVVGICGLTSADEDNDAVDDAHNVQSHEPRG